MKISIQDLSLTRKTQLRSEIKGLIRKGCKKVSILQHLKNEHLFLADLNLRRLSTLLSKLNICITIKYPAEIVDKVRLLYDEGRPRDEIAVTITRDLEKLGYDYLPPRTSKQISSIIDVKGITKEKRVQYTDKEDDFIIEMSKEGKNCIQISKALNKNPLNPKNQHRTRSSISNRKYHLGITRGYQRWCDVEIEILKQGYKEGLSTKKIMERLPGLNKDQIAKKAHALELRKGEYGRKETIAKNEDYFASPTVRNCQHAGLLAADGSVSEKNSTLSLCLHVDDFDSVQDFVDSIGYKGEVTISIPRRNDYSRGPQALVCICSAQKLLADLKSNFGIIQNKTHYIQPPKLDAFSNNAYAYIGGYFDGDGHIIVDNDNVFGITIGFTSCSKKILTWIANNIKPLCNAQRDRRSIAKVTKDKESNAYRLNVSGINAAYILRKLVPLNSQTMARKWGLANIYLGRLNALFPENYSTSNNVAFAVADTFRSLPGNIDKLSAIIINDAVRYRIGADLDRDAIRTEVNKFLQNQIIWERDKTKRGKTGKNIIRTFNS